MDRRQTIDLPQVVRALTEGYGPIEKILLFGSQARGDADEYSDLDLIIIKKTEKRFVQRLAEVPLLPVHADVFVYTPEEFEQMRETKIPLSSARSKAPRSFTSGAARTDGQGPAKTAGRMSMKQARQNAERWIRQAEHTLREAEHLNAHNLACFLAGQSAQQSLKAVLYFDGARFVRMHSIAELLQEVSKKWPDFLAFLPRGGGLGQFYLTTRYPDAVAEPAIPAEIFTAEQSAEAMATARAILEKSKAAIAKNPGD